MTLQELFITANQELHRVIEQIRDDQWQLEMPKATTWKPSNLATAICYHIYDDAWVPDVLDGKTKEEVGEQYESLLATENIRADYATYNERANNAVAKANDMQKTVHLSYGDFEAEEYLRHVISFRAFRSYDLAKLIGVNTIMKPELVDGLLQLLGPYIDQYRQMGVFPPALDVPDTAAPQTRLLAMVGRS